MNTRNVRPEERSVDLEAQVLVDSIWVRKSPSTSGTKIKKLNKGSVVKVTKQYKIWFKCNEGWICSKTDNGSIKLLKIRQNITSFGFAAKANSNESGEGNSGGATEEEKPPESNHEYIKDYIGSDVGNSSTDSMAFLKSVRGIHGMPYQFLDTTDIRLPGCTFGRKFSDKIITRIPLLLLTPGTPKFMADYNSKDREDLISYIGRGRKDDDIFNSLVNGGSSGEDDGKFYSFQFAYKEYYACVNPMLQRIARFLNIQDKEIDNVKLDKFSWENYTNEAFKGFVSSRESVAFYIDSDTQISESFSNSTGDSSLAQTVNGLSDMGREIQFLLGGAAGVEFDALKEENRGEVLSDFDAFADKYAKLIPKNLMNKLSGGFLTVASGGKMIFPEIWQDSDFSRSYNISLKLRTPESDNFSWFMNIAVPLVHLICLVAPRQLGSNGYQSPFLVRGFYKGFFNCDMGIITNMDIQKGDKGRWTTNGLPTVVDVNFTMKDLYQIMSITQDDKVIDLLKNTALLDYLANMCGINVNKPDILRTLDIYYTQLGNRVSDTITFNGFLGVEQALSNLAGSIFRK